MPLLCLLLLVLVPVAAARGETRVSAASISMPADCMPAANTGHITEPPGNLISGVVRRMLQDRRGHFWFGTQDGLFRYDGTSLVHFDLRDEFDREVTIMAIVEDNSGNIWIGCSTGGVVRYDGETFTTFTEADGLASMYVWSLFVDRAGLLWIGTYDGVSIYDGSTFTPFAIPASTRTDTIFGPTSPTIVWDISQDTGGNLWFAAEAGVHRYDGATLSRVPVMEDDSDTYVTSILGDRNGTVWFSTRYKGMIRLDEGVFTNVTREDGLCGIEAGRVYEDRSGNIWFPSEAVGVIRYDGTSYANILPRESFATGAATHSILEDTAGRIWFCGWLGVYRYDGKSVVQVTRNGPW